MYDVERDEIYFKDENFPVILSSGKSVTGMYSRFHEELEIKYVNSGQLTVMVDTKTVTAVEGEVIIINPYEVHSNLHIDGFDGVYDLVMMKLDFFEKVGIAGIDLRKLFTEKMVSFKNLVRNKNVADVMRRLAQCTTLDAEYDKLYVSGLLVELFALLQQSETQKITERTAGDERIKFFRSIEPAVIKIHDCYFEKLSGESLAELCGMSKFHFCRVFKRVMGVTPVQYQTEYRLHIADVLLQSRELSISGIAAQIGFEDEAYFSRCYKKHRGMAPKAMRMKILK